MNTNPARGMRDFLPDDVRKREYVIGVIRAVYEKYGYEPLETPAVENLSTLTDKYGEEGDQLMFKILKRGEKLAKRLESGEVRSENELSDLALRYDLTVPLARVVANRRNDLPRFFKRYQIQPVWRADRPARGRYREFYQCDADAIGSTSLLLEAELCLAVTEIFTRLGFDDYEVRLNHRELLFATLEAAGVPDEKAVETLVAIDKLDKIGASGVSAELEKRGIPPESAASLLDLIKGTADLTNEASIAKVSQYLREVESGLEALSEVARVIELADGARLRFDCSLARGLAYYTGPIFEVVLTDGDFSGSLAGGGRYDGLIGAFGKERIPAVGISPGLERILLIMDERGMFPDDIPSSPADVLVAVWNEDTIRDSLKLARLFREQGIRTLLYPQADKLGKQFKYADQTGIRFVCVQGESELSEGTVTLKDLASGDQETCTPEDAATLILA